MAISRVDFGGQTLIDLTNDTVTSASLLAGYTAHGADGEPILGTASGGGQIMVTNLDTGESVPLSHIYISRYPISANVSELGKGDIFLTY